MPKSRGRKPKKNKRARNQPRNNVRTNPEALSDGLTCSPGVRLRLAGPGEADEVDRLLNLSGVGLEPGMADAIEHRSISSGLIRALRARSIDVLHDLVESPTDLAGLAPALTMVIVGEDSTHHLVGAMLALPPFEFLAQITMAGVPLSIAARSALDIVKLKSLGVDEGSRGAGIGMALVEYCTNIYFDLGYKLAFGQIRAGSGLETYYSDARTWMPGAAWLVSDSDRPDAGRSRPSLRLTGR